MTDIMQVADKADMIVNGYAFTKDSDSIRVLNLNKSNKAMCISNEGRVLETSMDDIEIGIVKKYWEKNMELMGE